MAQSNMAALGGAEESPGAPGLPLHLEPSVQQSHTSPPTVSAFSIRPEGVAGSSDPLGLQVAYRTDNRVGDLVFVHGLGGSAWKTWSYDRETWSFWPHWLPEDDELLASFRISTFGYNSKFKGPATNLEIIDFAKDLLLQLSTEFGPAPNEPQRPIIFVAHSLGGLVVKKAYSLGKNDKHYSGLVSGVKGIVFLATPHRGTQYANILNNILSAAPIIGTSSKLYVAGLGLQSGAIQDINESFRQQCDGLFLCSFYETLKTSLSFTKVMVRFLCFALAALCSRT